MAIRIDDGEFEEICYEGTQFEYCQKVTIPAFRIEYKNFRKLISSPNSAWII